MGIWHLYTCTFNIFLFQIWGWVGRFKKICGSNYFRVKKKTLVITDGPWRRLCFPVQSIRAMNGVKVKRNRLFCVYPKTFCSASSLLINFSYLRGAWRDHCFPEPFSWFLHETGLESLKITPARCSFFLLKCQRKDSKKVKEHRQFRGVLGRWRTATIDRTTFHACQLFRKTAVFAVFSQLWGVIWREKAFRDQRCQSLTRNKSLSNENGSNCLMTSECVRTDSILPQGAGLEHGRCKQLIFSLSIFGILVERLSFWRLHFCSDFVTVFFFYCLCLCKG